ncbi:hypothetical protein T265_00515 [Opisthorchis viverrini]|uniref:Uncharacterized protein n=1 Tax=Opisthorchis viverrini TaxID=6198 RepID=A0A075ACK1_OPIVI|nr:hypothetical protein T265_00515 [Opisthorchis viverrini]KER33625.1 hypothetical protein T265_00515 [Opisthorchis viverrini]
MLRCNTLSVPSCHSTRRDHEGWDTARGFWWSNQHQPTTRNCHVRDTSAAKSPLLLTRCGTAFRTFIVWRTLLCLLSPARGVIANSFSVEPIRSFCRHYLNSSGFGDSYWGEMAQQPGSILALVKPSGCMAVRHRKGATAERFFYTFISGTADHPLPIKILPYGT